MTTALIIIDVQNDYFEGGKFQLVGANEALANVQKLEKHFHDAKLPIVYIQHISSHDGVFFLPNTDGAQLHSKLSVQALDYVIIKNHPNSFYKTQLQDTLSNLKVDSLYVCGMMTHMCVDTTVRAAADYGYKVTVFEDACATRDLQYGDTTIPAATVQKTYMASLNHTFATIKTTDNL